MGYFAQYGIFFASSGRYFFIAEGFAQFARTFGSGGHHFAGNAVRIKHGDARAGEDLKRLCLPAPAAAAYADDLHSPNASRTSPSLTAP